MPRLFAAAIALICLALVQFSMLSQAGDKAALKGAPATKAREETLALMEMLERQIETKGLHETVKLKQALEYLSDSFGGRLVVLVDREAFAAEYGSDSTDPYEHEVVLPPVPSKMLADTVLRIMMSQMFDGRATYVIRRGWIEITTEKKGKVASRLHHPAIVRSFERRPIAEVLQELADRAEVAIHLDPNIGNSANAQISATFRNCSLEEALVTVTEMTKLKFVVLERSIYVTTLEHARAMENEELKRNKQRESAPPRTKRLEPAR